MLARPGDGGSHLLHGVVGDVGNLVESKALDGVEDESLALVPASIAQGCFDLADQLASSGQLFGIVGSRIGDDVLLKEPVIGLMELQDGLIGRLDVLVAS